MAQKNNSLTNDKQDNGLPDDVEQLIDAIEAGSVDWYVLGGQPNLGIFLTFDMACDDCYSPETLSAIKALTNRFHGDKQVRQAILDYAFNIGAVYHEMGNSKPVWNLGHSVQ